jgi:hypothetical protein
MANVTEKTFIYYTLSALIDNCELACLAYELYVESLQTNVPLKTINYRMLKEYHLYNFFNYVANISKFYTLRENQFSKIRCEYLNKTIPLKPKSNINDRKIRNSLEHFEERIDNYFDGMINDQKIELDITDIYSRRISKKDDKIISIEIAFYKTIINITDVYKEIDYIKQIAFENIGNYIDLDFIMEKQNEKAKRYGLPETTVSIDKKGNKTYSR